MGAALQWRHYEDLGYTSFDLDTIKILIRRMELNENQTVQFNGTFYIIPY